MNEQQFEVGDEVIGNEGSTWSGVKAKVIFVGLDRQLLDIQLDSGEEVGACACHFSKR